MLFLRRVLFGKHRFQYLFEMNQIPITRNIPAQNPCSQQNSCSQEDKTCSQEGLFGRVSRTQ